MLRIWRAQPGVWEPRLRLEGQVAAEWVDLLARECATGVSASGRLTLDLSGLTGADGRGLALLRHLRASGVRFEGAIPLIEEMLGPAAGA